MIFYSNTVLWLEKNILAEVCYWIKFDMDRCELEMEVFV